MSNDKKPEDDTLKIDIESRHEVEAFHQQWKQFSHAQILHAIKEYGPYKKDIESHLRNQAEVL